MAEETGIVKAAQWREKSDEELEQSLKDMKQALFNLRFQHYTEQLENYMSIRQVKGNIARILTVMGERKSGTGVR